MQIKVIKYTGEEITLEVQSFEFRTNHVVNWIRVVLPNGDKEEINDIAVIKGSNKCSMKQRI